MLNVARLQGRNMPGTRSRIAGSVLFAIYLQMAGIALGAESSSAPWSPVSGAAAESLNIGFNARAKESVDVLNEMPPESINGYPSTSPLVGGHWPVYSDYPRESTWYTRIEYFRWNEQIDGEDFVNESGPLYTIGYTLFNDDHRVRAEFFGSRVNYAGGAQFPDGTIIPLNSITDYYGGRAEIDFFALSRYHPNLQYFLGIGLRVWNRHLPSLTLPSGVFVQGYDETYLTLYPYFGIETRHDPSRVWEFYGRMRIGLTAFTYEYVTFGSGTGLYPRVGVTALLEEGVRYGNWTVTGYMEIFGFAASGVTNQMYQPTSTLGTLGVKAGFSY
jgi:hypothetical protein